MRRVISSFVTIALVASCTPEVSPGGDRREDDVACAPVMADNGSEVAGACDVDLTINGKARARTAVSYKVGVGQGGGSAMNGNADFPAHEEDPGGSVYVELDEQDGYTLDAHDDGRVTIRPFPLDPKDPKGSADKLIIDVKGKNGVVRSSTVNCPGLTDFATYIQDHGLAQNNSESKCETADFKSGCFPCKGFSDLIDGKVPGQEAMFRSDIRARAGVIHTYTRNAAGPNQGPVIAAVIAIAAVVAGALGYAACGGNKGPNDTNGCTWSF